MGGMRYQPQGLARLDRASPLLKGAQSIISAASESELVSGRMLVKSGSGFGKSLTPKGRALAFRKDHYISTGQVMPAIGTASFVEFWYGIVTDNQGNNGNGWNDPSFVTGSNYANIALVTRIGNIRPNSETWGALYNWNTSDEQKFYSSGEVLTPGSLALLVVVRRQGSMDFWRDGRLVASVGSGPISIGDNTFLLGSFVDADYWKTANDTILAGRIVADWTPEQIRSFSANPWQIFEDPYEDELIAATVAVEGLAYPQGAAARTWVGTATVNAGARGSPLGVSATASVGAASASVGAIAITPGVSASGGVGMPTTSAGAQSASAGVTASTQVNAVIASAGAVAAPTGVSVGAQVGMVMATGGSASTASPAGVSAAALVGQPAAAGGASAAPSGVGATAAVGQATASVGTNGIATPAGVSASALAGTATASGAATCAPPGVAAATAVGTATASSGAGGTAAPAGVGAAAGVGLVVASAGASCAPVGVAAFASVGAVIAAGTIAIPGVAKPQGVAAYGRVGTATATGGGMFARAPAGSGYTPQRNEHQARPAQVGGARPSALQKAYR